MLIESINPAREEYIRIFEMMYNALERSSDITMLATPEFRHIKFSLCEKSDPDGDNDRYYIPSDTDPTMEIRLTVAMDGTSIALYLIWLEQNIRYSHLFNYDNCQIKSMFGEIKSRLRKIQPNGRRPLFCRYVPPKRREPTP